MKFSVLMATYYRDSAEHLGEALGSVFESSLLPEEVILVIDGPIGESLRSVVEKFLCYKELRVVQLEKNVGLGNALNEGLKHCSCDWVARFDSDDVCSKDRFHKQVEFIGKNPRVSLLSGYIEEFSGKMNRVSIKKVPLSHEDIVKSLKWRNPFNHMCVMFKKEEVLKASGYKNEYLYEDYSLWVRMVLNGSITANLPDILVHARVDNGMIARRGGMKYALSEIKAFHNFTKQGLVTYPFFIFSSMARFAVRVSPVSVRSRIYSCFLRN